MRPTKIKILAILCLLGSLATAGAALLTYEKGHEDLQYDETLQDDFTTAAGDDKLTIDFAALKARNPDMIGWIRVPGTPINYPVVQTTNNSTYLTQRFDGSATAYGTIFADHRCDAKNGNNLILYGHNQGKLNPVKFTALSNYLSDPTYIMMHPYVEYYDAETGERTIYDIFAAFRADITTQDNIDMYYRSVDDQGYKDYLDWLKRQDTVKATVTPEPDRKSLILSTCTDDADWQRVMVCSIAREK